MKLTGIARAVPSVVASSAMNTVSMILSQVSLAVARQLGRSHVPAHRRADVLHLVALARSGSTNVSD